jgi:hypothetical protein
MERRHKAQLSAAHLGAPQRMNARQSGSSLIELLTSLVFLSILTGMTYSFARAALISARVQEVKSEAQEVTVMALDMLLRDVRMAGFSAAGQPFSGVGAAGPDHVAVAADLNGDGDTADSDELIAYSYDAPAHALMRATGGTSPQPFVYHVAPDGVRFAFFDAQGHGLTAVGGELTPADRRRIHRIDVQLQVELPNPSPGNAAPLRSMVSGSACLRNR